MTFHCLYLVQLIHILKNAAKNPPNHDDVEIDPWMLQVAAISPQCCHDSQVVP